MDIVVTGRHTQISDRFRAYLDDKLAKVAQIAPKVTRVDVSTDGGINWRQARLETPVLSKAVTRFNIDWVWDGKPAILQSRAADETGYVQPSYGQLRAARGTKSIYHNNAIQSWKVVESGEVSNVQVL